MIVHLYWLIYLKISKSIINIAQINLPLWQLTAGVLDWPYLWSLCLIYRLSILPHVSPQPQLVDILVLMGDLPGGRDAKIPVTYWGRSLIVRCLEERENERGSVPLYNALWETSERETEAEAEREWEWERESGNRRGYYWSFAWLCNPHRAVCGAPAFSCLSISAAHFTQTTSHRTDA